MSMAAQFRVVSGFDQGLRAPHCARTCRQSWNSKSHWKCTLLGHILWYYDNFRHRVHANSCAYETMHETEDLPTGNDGLTEHVVVDGLAAEGAHHCLLRQDALCICT